MQLADLHIHSVYSDSTQNIDEIFRAARKKNLAAIAITDHDTVQGLPEAEEKSREYGIELVGGIELTCAYENTEIHMLGYLFDHRDSSFLSAIEDIRDLRKKRLIKMAEKVNSLGKKVDIDDLVDQLNVSIATRLHLAQYMLETEQVGSIWEAFKKYLSPGKPAYVHRNRFSVKEAIDLIHSVDGVAVLAHPNYIKDKTWIPRFAGFGLDGLEAVYPSFSAKLSNEFKSLAGKLGLFTTGGSDAHGDYKDFTAVGETAAPYEWVLKMKDAKRPFVSQKNI